MTQTFPAPVGLHWRAALAAVVLTAVLLGGAKVWATRREQAAIHALALRSFPQKDQGLAWQRAAVRAPDILPLYGSSELTKPIADKSSDFFAHAPTGFEVSPLGKVGTTSLPILQRLGALGADLRGKKIVISISPTWFLTDVIHPHYYEGNFSTLAASRFFFGTNLSLALKRDLARRMQLYPPTFAKAPLLGSAVDFLAADSLLDRLAFLAIWPLGYWQTAMRGWQDDFESMLGLIREKPATWSPQRAVLDWPALLTAARETALHTPTTEIEKPASATEERPPRTGDHRGFVARLQDAPEWIDFTLLLRVLTELHARPLLVSMPMNGAFYDHTGVSRAERDAYYEKMRALATTFHFPLVESTDRDEDPAFLDGHHDHLSAEGWMVYNRILDDFFHDRPLPN